MLPKKRTVGKILVYKVMGGHWHLVFTANKGTAKDKPNSPAEKLVRIDLIQSMYRVVYNAEPEPETSAPAETCEFAGTQPTVEDIYRIVLDVAQAKGRWTEGFNCQAFVNEVMERLGTLPATLTRL